MNHGKASITADWLMKVNILEKPAISTDARGTEEALSDSLVK